MGEFSQGHPRYFRPICIRHPWGFVGGPSGYEETDTPDGGPIILEREAEETEADE